MPVLLTSFLLDLAFGDPRWLPHPVVLMGKFISRGEKLLWSGKTWRDFCAGMILSLVLLVTVAGITWAVIHFLKPLPLLVNLILIAGLGSTTLATRGLLDAVGDVERPLRDRNLQEARQQLSHIVGRETSSLSEEKVLRATLESLAESTCDGIVAPLFYLFLGGVPLAMSYKAVNTLDSMIGYRTERYLYFGKFAAHLDDALNYIPARLTAFFIVIATFLLRLNGALAIQIMRRDHANHLSPNAGYPESALAGALAIKLGGPSIYFGREVWKPFIGDELVSVNIEMLKEGRSLCRLAAILSLATFVMLATVQL